MKKIGIIFGGSGYIGYFLTQRLIKDNLFDYIIIFDLKEPQIFLEPHLEERVQYLKGDVRKPIKIDTIEELDNEKSWVFNLAAIHREPGHDYHEYFDTNIAGAYNINSFAREHKIQNIFFTSSIAPYGKSLLKRTEKSQLYPETAYGISKALAEKIHQIWMKEDNSHRLIIVRPSVIFGPHDPGNVYRMIKAIKKGTFILPDGGKVIKAYGYVYGLIDSIIFTMNKSERLIIYNYAENPLVPLNEMAKIVKRKFNYNKPVLGVSVKTLSVIAYFLSAFLKVFGKTTDIHPVRVKKAGFPTNIEASYLIRNGFEFKYDFERALDDWKRKAPEDF